MDSSKETPGQPRQEAGICLTFDDWFVRGWWRARELLRDFDACATFFVAKPHELDRGAIRRLRSLQEEGHEIGCHTLTHTRLPKFMAQHRHREDRDAHYIREEILPALDILRGHGFEVTSFSYPYFKHKPRLTGLLMQHFRMVRDSGPAPAPIHAIYPGKTRAVVGVMGMLDRTGMELGLDYYRSRFELLASHGGFGAFCGHAVGPDRPKNAMMRTSMSDLEEVLMLARDHGLSMPTLRETGCPGWMFGAQGAVA